jgi:hypothetical protein
MLWIVYRLCGLVVRDPQFDSKRYQLSSQVVDLERGPLSLVSTTEELFERKSSGSGLEIRHYGRMGSAALTTRHPYIRKSWY